jgi:hypothetical protein
MTAQTRDANALLVALKAALFQWTANSGERAAAVQRRRATRNESAATRAQRRRNDKGKGSGVGKDVDGTEDEDDDDDTEDDDDDIDAAELAANERERGKQSTDENGGDASEDTREKKSEKNDDAAADDDDAEGDGDSGENDDDVDDEKEGGQSARTRALELQHLGMADNAAALRKGMTPSEIAAQSIEMRRELRSLESLEAARRQARQWVGGATALVTFFCVLFLLCARKSHNQYATSHTHTHTGGGSVSVEPHGARPRVQIPIHRPRFIGDGGE